MFLRTSFLSWQISNQHEKIKNTLNFASIESHSTFLTACFQRFEQLTLYECISSQGLSLLPLILFAFQNQHVYAVYEALSHSKDRSFLIQLLLLKHFSLLNISQWQCFHVHRRQIIIHFNSGSEACLILDYTCTDLSSTPPIVNTNLIFHDQHFIAPQLSH